MASKFSTPVGRVQVVLLVNVSVTIADFEAADEVVSRHDLIVTLVALVTAAVAVNLNCKSTYCADALMAVPLVVVVPAIEVHVVLS